MALKKLTTIRLEHSQPKREHGVWGGIPFLQSLRQSAPLTSVRSSVLEWIQEVGHWNRSYRTSQPTPSKKLPLISLTHLRRFPRPPTAVRWLSGGFLILFLPFILASLLFPNSPRADALDPGLVSYFEFNENTGSSFVSDSSLVEATGVMNNMSSNWVTGVYGSALEFDGTSSYIDVPMHSSYQNTDEFTVMAWVYIDDTSSSYQHIVSAYDYDDSANEHGFIFGRHFSGLGLTVFRGNHHVAVTLSSMPSQSNWHHIAATFDSGNEIKLYLNGVEQTPNVSDSSGTPNYTVTYDYTNSGPDVPPLRIGARSDSTEAYFNGRIDEVKLYDYVRNDTQIVEDMTQQAESPLAPTFAADSLHDKIRTNDTTPQIRFSAVDEQGEDVVYQVEWSTNSDFTGASSAASDANAGFQNLDTPADSSPFTEGQKVAYTWQTPLTNSTLYFYRVRAKDPAGSGSYGAWSETRTFTVDTSLTANGWSETHAAQFATDTLDPGLEIDTTNNRVQSTGLVTVESADSDSNWASSNTDVLTVSASSVGQQEGSGLIMLTPNGDWWNNWWRKRKAITISNTAGALSGYQVLLDVSYDSDMQSDFDDLRFTNATGTELDYWLESKTDSSSALVWVETDSLAASGDTTIYMYYGNSAATSASSAANTFTVGIKHFTGSCPSGNAACSSMDNHTEADTIRSTLSPSSVTDVTVINDNTGGDYFYRRYRFLFVPNSSGNHSFGVNVDDAGDFGAFPGDGYGGGYLTSHPFGAHTVLASWYGLSGTGTCGVSGTVGTTSLTAGQGYWIDFLMHEAASGQLAQACIRYAAGAFQTVSTSMTIGTVYRREYTSGAEPTSSFGSEEGMAGQTATATVSSIDLSSADEVSFWVRSDRTGTFMNFHMGESSLTEQTTAFTINAPHTWERKTWDVSGIASGSRDAITKIGVQITDDSTPFSFLIDGIQATGVGGTHHLLSTPINASLITASNWDKFSFSDVETNGSITYKLYYDEGGTPTLIPDIDLPSNSTGFTSSPVDLSMLDTATYPTLYLGAELTYSGGSPQLLDWQVNLNDPPLTPTITYPANTAVINTLMPTLQFASTDTESDYLRYKIEMCLDAEMSLGCETFDQTASQTGWTGQNTQTSTAYTSGTTAQYSITTPLLTVTTYYWRASAIDPGGSNWWGEAHSPVWSFTTPNLMPPAACILEESTDDSTLLLRWDDPNLIETGYEIERNVSEAGFAAFETTSANVTSTTDTDITLGNIYTYRIRALLGESTSDWCNFPILNLKQGSLQLEGIRVE